MIKIKLILFIIINFSIFIYQLLAYKIYLFKKNEIPIK